jgi:hypothetical protein
MVVSGPCALALTLASWGRSFLSGEVGTNVWDVLTASVRILTHHPEIGIGREETVDFRLDLNTPVNWRDGQTELSGVFSVRIPTGPARIRTRMQTI